MAVGKMSTLVPKTRTIITLDQFVPSLARAIEDSHGDSPEVVDCCIVWGKFCNECGHPGPGQSCWCNNIGNIRGVSPKGNYCLLAGAYEFRAVGQPLLPGEKEIPVPAGAKLPPNTYCYLPDPAKQLFRAYADLDEAMDDYVLTLGKRFGRTWRELVASGTTPEAFVAAMKADSYFTGDAAQYTKNVASIARSVMPRVEAILRKPAIVPGVPALELLSRLDGGPATPLRAGAGENDPGLMPDPAFDGRPWWRRLLG